MNSLPIDTQKTIISSIDVSLWQGNENCSNSEKWEAHVLLRNKTSSRINQNLVVETIQLTFSLDIFQISTNILLLSAQIYRNTRSSHNHSHYHVLYINDPISDHKITSSIPGKRMWAKGPNQALSLEGTTYFSLCGRNIYSTLLLTWKGHWWDCWPQL